MGAESQGVTDAKAALGALLVLLHDGVPPDPVEVSYRVWRHRARAHEAFVADLERQKRRGTSVSQFVRSEGTDEPDESEATVRIWRSGERARIEHHGGDRDGYYAVTDGPLWWRWDEATGARSNQDDPSVGGGFGGELQIMLNPIPLLSSLRVVATGRSELAGRRTITARGTPRDTDSSRGGPFELHELGTGADHYQLEIDRQLGVLLGATAVRDGQPFHRITTLSLQTGPIADEIFQFQPPAGEEIAPVRAMHRLEHVTPTEAQRRAPFTVFIPDTVPTTWQVRCRFIGATERPPSPTQIGISYHSVDGHESVSLTQAAAGPSNPYRHHADHDNWEPVTREGISMRTRPAHWGQTQVELERDGTFIHLMSDNLTRDQVLKIAAGLRPAPSTSSI